MRVVPLAGMDLGIAGTRAAVAAGSAGLGLGAARALVAEGVNVVVCGRDVERLDRAVAELRGVAAPGTEALGTRGDVSTPEGASQFVDDAVSMLGGLEILVTNAGGPPPGTATGTDIEGYRRALDLNLLSTIAMAQRAVPHMEAGGWGRIVAITSVGAREPIPDLAASVVARVGATGFVKTLATELADRNITVNAVQPGLHATARVTELHGDTDAMVARVPVGFLGDPDEFGQVVAFLASRQARFITGSSIPVEGGAVRGLQ